MGRTFKFGCGCPTTSKNKKSSLSFQERVAFYRTVQVLDKLLSIVEALDRKNVFSDTFMLLKCELTGIREKAKEELD